MKQPAEGNNTTNLNAIQVERIQNSTTQYASTVYKQDSTIYYSEVKLRIARLNKTIVLPCTALSVCKLLVSIVSYRVVLYYKSIGGISLC